MFDNVRRVTRQVVTYGSADAALYFVTFLLFPLYARVLPPEIIGALGVLGAVEAHVKVVYRWGLEGAFLRLFFEQRTDEDRRILAGTIAIFLAAANGAVLAALIAGSSL